MGLIVGIDPGITGAVAAVGPAGGLHWVIDMPVRDAGKKGRSTNEIDAGELGRFLRVHLSEIDEVWVEDVHPMPKIGGSNAGHGTLGAFSLGDSRGAIRGVLECLGLATMRVPSRTWKRMYGLDADKDKALACVKRIYPGSTLFARKKDHGRAEAVLIARYAAQQRRLGDAFLDGSRPELELVA